VKEPEQRQEALEQLRSGDTPDMLKERFAANKKEEPEDPQERLRREKERILKNISRLNERLAEIDRELGGEES
jgi:glutathione S-transferase